MYLLFENWQYEPSVIRGVFSTRELAEESLEKLIDIKLQEDCGTGVLMMWRRVLTVKEIKVDELILID